MMPTPKPIDEPKDATLSRVNVILDFGTLRALDTYCQRHPDVQSRSAAIRALAHEWRRKAKA